MLAVLRTSTVVASKLKAVCLQQPVVDDSNKVRRVLDQLFPLSPICPAVLTMQSLVKISEGYLLADLIGFIFCGEQGG